jgi:hypothetical protein
MIKYSCDGVLLMYKAHEHQLCVITELKKKKLCVFSHYRERDKAVPFFVATHR